MKNETLKYSDHYEILVALVTYLAVCNRPVKSKGKTIDNATAIWLTEYLGFQSESKEVEFVLDSFKNIFRRSRQPHNGHYRYSLLLRYSHRSYTDPNAPDVSEPLPNNELFSLLNFISNRVAIEQDEKRQKENSRNDRVAMSVAVLSAVIAAIASVVSAFIK
jgi:hypothetical protein